MTITATATSDLTKGIAGHPPGETSEASGTRLVCRGGDLGMIPPRHKNVRYRRSQDFVAESVRTVLGSLPSASVREVEPDTRFRVCLPLPDTAMTTDLVLTLTGEGIGTELQLVLGQEPTTGTTPCNSP